MPMPWETAASPEPKGNGMPWEKAPASTPSDGFQPTQYGFKVRPLDLGNGKQTVQREDGAAYFGPEQGNKGKPGWFDANGNRLGDAPGKDPAFMDRFTNDLQQKAKAQANLPLLGQIVPGQVSGMAKGLIDTTVAPAQLISHIAGSTAMDPVVNALQQDYKQNWQTSKGGEILGQSLPFLTTMGGSAAAQAPTQVLTTAQKIRAALAGIAKASGTGAIAAPTMTPETGVQSESDYWNRKLGEAQAGAAVGGGLGTAGQVVGGVASRLRAPMNSEAQAIQDLGGKFGVRTLAPDLAPPGQMAKLGVLAESVPGSGMVSQRLAQQAEAQVAAQKLLDQHGIQGDASAAIQQGLKDKFANTNAIKNALYDDVAQTAGDRRVFLPKTFDALRAATEEAQASGLPENSVQRHVDTLASRLYQGRDEAGKLMAAAADTTFTGMQKTRSDLNDELSRLYKAGDAKGSRILKGVKDAINQDMADFATKSGDTDLAGKWSRADQYYRQEVVPLKDSMLKAARGSNEPDQIYGKFIQAGKGDRAQNFYNALDTDGQAAVRSQMVQDAMAKATDGAQPFSPAKFAQSLEKIKDSTGVFFKGQDKFELDGFVNLMRHVQRAGQVGENPTNGQRMVSLLVAGEGVGSVASAAMGHPAALAVPAVSMASANALTRVFASPTGKRLLLAASSLKPGSPALDKLIQQDLPKILAMETPKNITPFRPASLPAAADTGSPDTVAQP